MYRKFLINVFCNRYCDIDHTTSLNIFIIYLVTEPYRNAVLAPAPTQKFKTGLLFYTLDARFTILKG
jgi:hypothetical protein